MGGHSWLCNKSGLQESFKETFLNYLFILLLFERENFDGVYADYKSTELF